MPIDVSAQVEIARPIAEVWAFLDAPVNLPRWQQGVRHAWREGPAGVGAHDFHERRFLWWRSAPAQEIVEYVPPQRFCSRARSGPMALEFESDLAPTSAGTLVTNRLRAQPRGALALAAPLVRPLMRRRLKSDLARLKAVLEGQAS